jgi:hypothetical protein
MARLTSLLASSGLLLACSEVRFEDGTGGATTTSGEGGSNGETLLERYMSACEARRARHGCTNARSGASSLAASKRSRQSSSALPQRARTAASAALTRRRKPGTTAASHSLRARDSRAVEAPRRKPVAARVSAPRCGSMTARQAQEDPPPTTGTSAATRRSSQDRRVFSRSAGSAWRIPPRRLA